MSSGDEFSGAQFRPFALLFSKAQAADHIPLHLNVVGAIANIDIDSWLSCLKIWGFGQVSLLVLIFDRVVSGATVYVVAIYTNTHGGQSL